MDVVVEKFGLKLVLSGQYEAGDPGILNRAPEDCVEPISEGFFITRAQLVTPKGEFVDITMLIDETSDLSEFEEAALEVLQQNEGSEP